MLGGLRRARNVVHILRAILQSAQMLQALSHVSREPLVFALSTLCAAWCHVCGVAPLVRSVLVLWAVLSAPVDRVWFLRAVLLDL